MQGFKNILVGFAVSFVGSIPFGYLNVIGYEIFKEFGLISTAFYLLGVITIEFFVIYFTLIFADKLMHNHKLLLFIKGFSVVFMFILAYLFFANGNPSQDNTVILSSVSSNFYRTGIILSCFNFIQIPFWLSWNLYLLNGNFINFKNTRKLFYVFGTMLGTFLGMLALIVSLKYVSNQTDFLTKYLLGYIIPIVFIGLGSFQAWKFYKEFEK